MENDLCVSSTAAASALRIMPWSDDSNGSNVLSNVGDLKPHKYDAF